MNQLFDYQRALNLTNLKFNLNKKLILIALASYMGLVFIITYFMAGNLDDFNSHKMNSFHLIAMSVLVFAGAVWVAGRAYQDMNTNEKAISQLMLPASTLEKYIIPLVISSLGWIIGVVAVYTIYANLLNGLWSVLYGIHPGFYNPFVFHEMKLSEAFQAFFLVHSIFFLGGLSFKTYPVIKTILAGFVVNVSFTVVMMITATILFGGQAGIISNNNEIEAYFQQFFTPENIERVKTGVKLFFSIVLPVIFYIAAFYKLKEKEA